MSIKHCLASFDQKMCIFVVFLCAERNSILYYKNIKKQNNVFYFNSTPDPLPYFLAGHTRPTSH